MFRSIFLFLACCVAINAKSVSAPLPRSKGSKGGQGLKGSISQGFFGKLVREIKSNFCSEMEALTLQLTKPDDTSLPVSQFEELVTCLNAEYENPVFLVSLMCKLSRKLCEPNIFTKLKCLVVLHKITELSDSPARHAIMKCINTLQKETDVKTDDNYFSVESIGEMEKAANNVAELEVIELSKRYADYVFDYITIRGDKSSLSQRSAEKADLCLRLLEQGEAVEDHCGSKLIETSKISRECSERMREDRSWLVKQLAKLSEMELADEALESDVKLALAKYGKGSKVGEKAKVLRPKVTVVEDEDEDAEKDEKKVEAVKSSVAGVLSREDVEDSIDKDPEDEEEEEEEEKQEQGIIVEEVALETVASTIAVEEVSIDADVDPADDKADVEQKTPAKAAKPLSAAFGTTASTTSKKPNLAKTLLTSTSPKTTKSVASSDKSSKGSTSSSAGKSSSTSSSSSPPSKKKTTSKK